MLLPKHSSKSTETICKQPKSVQDYFCAEDSNPKFREYMEDSQLILNLEFKSIDKYGGFNKQGYFAVFDGHGGNKVADYCASRLHEILLNILKKETWKGPKKSLDESFIKVL